MFLKYYVEDGIFVEVQWGPDGRRCRRASVRMASDYFRLFGGRRPRDPTLVFPNKISPWDTVLCVVGWDIDTVALTISVPVAKMEQLRDKIREWPSDRTVASGAELRSLISQLTHLSEVVRPGK